jgi:hypothetical protein
MTDTDPDVSHADDNIWVRVYDSDDAPTPESVRDAAPKREYTTHNVTRSRYHEAVIGELNGVNADIEVDALALGDSTADTSTLADTAILGNETFRTTTIDTDTSGQTFRVSIFIDSTEANDTFEELALVAERSQGDLGINRALIDDPGGLLSPKSAGETVTIDIEITQADDDT